MPPCGWQPDPAWPPAPNNHRYWRAPKPSRRQRAGLAGLVVTVVTATLMAVAALAWAVDEYGHPIYGPHACNNDDGNSYIEDALIDRLPEDTLRSYMDTGPDCDDRRTGSIAAAWSATARPADVIGSLVREGWTRTDPETRTPAWYTANAPAGDPAWRCLVANPGAWQTLGRAEYPTRSCSHPATEQIVLTTERGPRVFVARFGPYGMTVDAAHQRDGDGARAIQQGQLPGEDYS